MSCFEKRPVRLIGDLDLADRPPDSLGDFLGDGVDLHESCFVCGHDGLDVLESFQQGLRPTRSDAWKALEDAQLSLAFTPGATAGAEHDSTGRPAHLPRGKQNQLCGFGSVQGAQDRNAPDQGDCEQRALHGFPPHCASI